jgi:hypothetical protein
MLKVEVIEVVETDVAEPVIAALPGWISLGTAPVWKLSPVIVMVTVAPCPALLGEIFVIEGP